MGCFKFNNLYLLLFSTLVTLSMTARRGITQRDIDKILYSDSTVLVVVMTCIVHTQRIGQLGISVIFPVQDVKESGLAPDLLLQPQAKAASTITSVLRRVALLGSDTIPLSAVLLVYCPILSKANLCKRSEIWTKPATLETARLLVLE